MRLRIPARTNVVAAALAAALGWPAAAPAQHREPPPPAAYALESVTVVRADGSRSEDVTLVVRGEFVEALGADAEIPADAQRLEGDSLVVYPGLVDAQGAAGLEFPQPDVGWDTIQSWAPPRSLQGFTPARRAVAVLDATGADFRPQRRAGVVALAAHPDGRVMPGRGTLLLLRKHARRPGELVLTPALGPTFSFRGARGVYPSTLFGVIAFMRQQFEDARRDREIAARFARSPERLTAPAWDADREVLREALAGETRVFFRAHGADDIRRVLGLAAEYGFRPVIVGGRDAWKVPDLLRERDVPVLVSVDFPEPERWEPEEDEAEPAEGDDPAADPSAEPAEPRPADPAAEAAQQEPALDAATADEKRRLEEMYANAGRLADAGVAFALTSGGGEADLLEGARKAVEYGLSPDDALRALTATPASLLGVPHVTRVEESMAATFIVADGPLFDESSRILYTFVEGALEENGDAGGGPQPGDEPPEVDVTGTWTVEFTVEGEPVEGTMELEQRGATFEGSVTTPMATARIVDGVVSGAEIRFTLKIDAGPESGGGSFSGEVEGDRASGSGSITMGDESMTLRWTAERTAGDPGRVGAGAASAPQRGGTGPDRTPTITGAARGGTR